MAKFKYKKKLKKVSDLKVDDEFKIGGMLVQIEALDAQGKDMAVLYVNVVGAVASQSKARLILNPNLPITILK